MNPEPGTYRRWYDHDPMLMEVLDLLKSFESDVREQAEIFLARIEEQIGKDKVEKLYAAAKPSQFGNRWYDKDPTVSRAVELLRIVPPDVQRQAAQKFLESMKMRGISPELLKQGTPAAEA
jgi:hypothetical protein